MTPSQRLLPLLSSRHFPNELLERMMLPPPPFGGLAKGSICFC